MTRNSYCCGGMLASSALDFFFTADDFCDTAKNVTVGRRRQHQELFDISTKDERQVESISTTGTHWLNDLPENTAAETPKSVSSRTSVIRPQVLSDDPLAQDSRCVLPVLVSSASRPLDIGAVNSRLLEIGAVPVSSASEPLDIGAAPAGSAQKSPYTDAMPEQGVMVAASPILSLPRSGHHPPPVCTGLVLPDCDACFSVALHELESVPQEGIILFGMSGRPLLRASLDRGPGLRKLSLAMKPKRSPTLGSIERRRGEMSLQLRSRKDEPYGDLNIVGDMRRFVLVKAGIEIMRANFDLSRNQLIITSAEDEGSLAVAMPSETGFSSQFHGEPHLDVRVNAGVDAVLALLCTLGIILLAVEDD